MKTEDSYCSCTLGLVSNCRLLIVVVGEDRYSSKTIYDNERQHVPDDTRA